MRSALPPKMIAGWLLFEWLLSESTGSFPIDETGPR
jgi:hypothetical protein